jgi:hypothetical protein
LISSLAAQSPGKLKIGKVTASTYVTGFRVRT